MRQRSKKNSKTEKAQFLKNLLLGKATIADAPTSQSLADCELWLTTDEKEYENMKTHEIITAEEHNRRNKNKTVITFS